MKRLLNILFMAALTGINFPAFSQQEHFRIQSYGVKDGLSHPAITCLFKDSRGLLWVGTEFGLNMFDGSAFTSFFNNPGDTNCLPHNKILSIGEDKQHRLWIGTQKGVSCFDLLSRQFINYSPFNKGAFHLNIENAYAYVSKDNRIWIGHNNGVIHLDPNSHKSKYYSFVLSPPNEFRNRYAASFLEDNKGQLWVGTSLGVHRLNKQTDTFQSFAFPAGIPNEAGLNACTRLFQDQYGTLYSGTWNGGIIYFDNAEQQFKPLLLNDITKVPFYIHFDRDAIWVSGIGGLYRSSIRNLREEKGTQPWHSYNTGNAPNISATDIYQILPDNGFLWLASSEGLKKMNTANNAITNYSHLSINNWNTLSILEHEPGKLYALNGKALMIHDLKKKTVTKFADSREQAWQLFRSHNGYLLTQKPGLFCLDDNLNTLEVLTHNDNKGQAEYFNAVYEDSDGMIWLTRGRNGIRTYNTKTKTWESLFLGRAFSIIKEDEHNNIWLAGVFTQRYDRKTKTFTHIRIYNPIADSIECNSITGVSPAGNGIVWLCSPAGLYYYDYSKDSVLNIPLPSNISPDLSGILADKHGHVWIESAGKLVMYDIQQKVFKTFTEADGYIGSDMGSRFGLLQNGNIAVGYNGGIAIIDPSQISKITNPVIPQFTAITIDALPLTPGSTVPKLAYNQSISFNFVSPLYTSGDRNQYAYKLQPLDKEWNWIGNNTTQRFANLPAGEYTFIVKAATASGQSDETFNSFAFIIKPPFWKTWWFLSFVIFLIIGSLLAFYRYRINQLMKMERMRTRIATDLHDDIGATLSSISMYSDAVKQQVKEKLPHLEPVLDKMGENSRDMVNSMSDIVWAINPANDDGSKLTERMERYARDLCAMKNVWLQFNPDASIQNIILPLEYRKNIYLIFKESLNNALKYASAEHISIDILKHNGELIMKIEDDGKGFEPGTVVKGNGLVSISERAKEIKGQSVIESRVGKGTMIYFSCPLP